MVAQNKPLNLPYNQADRYWLCVVPRDAAAGALVGPSLQALGLSEKSLTAGRCYLLQAPRVWNEAWQRIHQALQTNRAEESVEIAVIGGAEPGESEIAAARASAARITAIADSLWLGEALIAGNVLCYLQPVVSANDKVFGYESFARVRRGVDVIGGAAIVKAAHALGIEYAIDRQLHIQAIKTFVSSDCGGFLFINFFPGFIQRPEVYLEGLSETARTYGVVPKHIVLDFTKSGEHHDMQHMKRVCDYARGKGYALALDDIGDVAAAKALVPDIRPDYVKIDMKLIHRITDNINEQDAVRYIVQLCHEHGAMAIAEGVETAPLYEKLKALSVDLFQGYHFAPPLPVEAVQKKGTAG